VDCNNNTPLENQEVGNTGLCSRGGASGEYRELKVRFIEASSPVYLWSYAHSWACDLNGNIGISSPEEYLPLSITAEIAKTYTDADLKYFQTIGITPIYYSVIFE
jgi:hypothetical protein